MWSFALLTELKELMQNLYVYGYVSSNAELLAVSIVYYRLRDVRLIDTIWKLLDGSQNANVLANFWVCLFLNDTKTGTKAKLHYLLVLDIFLALVLVVVIVSAQRC